jgi:hypothetical protein
MTTTMEFGKHKGKRYEDVPPDYYTWCKKLQTKGRAMQHYIDYIDSHHLAPPTITYTGTFTSNASSLSHIMTFPFRQLYMESITDITPITNDDGMSPAMFGIFIDYLVRYILSKRLGKEFTDNRIQTMLQTPAGVHGDSYERMKAFEATDQDIYDASINHMISFGNPYEERTLTANYTAMLCGDDDSYHVINWLLANGKEFHLNPTLDRDVNENLHLVADADLIVDDAVIDMKCSKSQMTDEWANQLLIYTFLAELREYKPINFIKILNPLRGEVVSYTLDDKIKSDFEKYILQRHVTE